MGNYIDVPTLAGDGSFRAYRAEPSGPPKAAIVVIQEIFGVNVGIRRKADDWAADGYLALAPDMFWRFRPGYDVDPDVEAELQDAFEVRKSFDPNAGVGDIEATIRVARDLAGARKVGVVGFCMGGRMAYLAATRTDADASVGYYGAGIDASLNEAHAIAKPLLLHFAGEDHFIPPETVAKVEAALASNARATVYTYAGVDHGFAAASGKRRDESAATQADARTRAFFAEHLV